MNKPFPETQVHLVPPDGFNPMLEGAGCFCLSRGKFLLLKRSLHCAFGGTWCNPGGKFETGETKEQAVQRELREEIGIEVLAHRFEYLKTLYTREEKRDFIFHLFRIDFGEEEPVVTLSSEHVDFCWTPLSEVWRLPLIPGGKECYELFYK